MSVIATVEVAAEDFTLGDLLGGNPDITVRLDHVIPLGETFIPYFWASNDAVGKIKRALREEPDIEAFRIVDTVDSESLVRVEWNEGFDGILDILIETSATILEAVGVGGTWTFHLRFAHHDDLTTFYRRSTEDGFAVEPRRVHNPARSGNDGVGPELTDTQRETLRVALELGYFDVPRRTNLSGLAAELDVSDTAVSQRLRRGISTVLLAMVAGEDDRVRVQ